jgi:hypothetical protein
VHLFFFEAPDKAFERLRPFRSGDLDKVEVKLGLLLDDVMTDGTAAVTLGRLPSQRDADVVPVVNLCSNL